MKKSLFIIGATLSFGLSLAQNTFPVAANTAVGIGTGTGAVSGSGGLRLKVTTGVPNTSGVQLTNLTSGSPTTSGLLGKALSVNSSGNLVLVPVANSDTSIYSNDGTLALNRTVTMNGKNLMFKPNVLGSEFYIDGISGRVGLGTVTPVGYLDVNGTLPNGTTFSSNDQKYKECLVLNAGSYLSPNKDFRTFKYFDLPQSNFDTQPQVHLAIEDRNDANRLRFIATANGSTWFALSNRLQQEHFTVNENNNSVRMILPMSDSYIGIGTSNFTDGADTYRLAVKGAIRADRVRVYTTWADFVFEKNYQLPSLEEVEKHIVEKGHLKDIPSAKEVEEKGIELGEMNKRLLQKVEELTLYIIEMNKELQEVKNQLNKK